MRYEVYGNQGVLIDDLVEIAKTNGMTVVAEERACCLVVETAMSKEEVQEVFKWKADLVGIRSVPQADKPKLYLAGPMRGKPFYNFVAFDLAAQELSAEWNVLSPADMDRKVGFDALKLPGDTDWTLVPEHFDFHAAVERDLEAIDSSEAIYLLAGWETSKGACMEKAYAEMKGKHVLYQKEVERDPLFPQEIRVKNESTGGEKGSKLARFDLLPAGPLWELAEHTGKGAKKYADRNWERGYAWSLSFAAMMRHAWAFWLDEDMDKETGSKHIIAVAWHALALAQFMDQHKELDDRPKEVKQ